MTALTETPTNGRLPRDAAEFAIQGRKEAEALKEVTLFTDGSCLGNPGPGGWACILRYGKHERILRGVELRTTNNRMELVAAINGLLVLTERCRVTVITDSKVFAARDDGVPSALASLGWCNSRGEAIANQDLWERLASAAGLHETTWRWVRGHGSDPDQDRCDALAKEAARTVAAGGTAGPGGLTLYPYIYGRESTRSISSLEPVCAPSCSL